MHEEEPELSALHSLDRAEIIEIHDSSKRKVSLFDQLIGPEDILPEPDSIQFLDPPEPLAVKQECKIEEESPVIHQAAEQSRTQEEPQRLILKIESPHCNCGRSRCTKNYCACFRERNGCGQQCTCRECDNKASWKQKKSKPLHLFPFWSMKDLKWN